MSRDAQLKRVLDSGLVAIIRSPSSDVLVDVAEALVAGGIEVMEVTFTVPNALEVTAWCDEPQGRVVMGVAHRERPLHGVQFHPESILTEHGAALVANFLRTAP